MAARTIPPPVRPPLCLFPVLPRSSPRPAPSPARRGRHGDESPHVPLHTGLPVRLRPSTAISVCRGGAAERCTLFSERHTPSGGSGVQGWSCPENTGVLSPPCTLSFLVASVSHAESRCVLTKGRESGVRALETSSSDPLDRSGPPHWGSRACLEQGPVLKAPRLA